MLRLWWRSERFLGLFWRSEVPEVPGGVRCLRLPWRNERWLRLLCRSGLRL